MPFKSAKQKKWMFKNKPEMAKKWADENETEDSAGPSKGWKKPKAAPKKKTATKRKRGK
jgi:hypothetical protein